VLDGLERVHWSLAEVLAPLVHHRFLQLPDGSRLISQHHYNQLLENSGGLTSEELSKAKVFPICDRFRLIALADSAQSATTGKWLNDQLLSLFLYYSLEPASMEEMTIVKGQLPGVDEAVARRLLGFVHELRKSQDHAVGLFLRVSLNPFSHAYNSQFQLRSVAVNSLSLRRIIFLLKCQTIQGEGDLTDAIRRATLARFMPSTVREAFEDRLKDSGLAPQHSISLRKRKLSSPASALEPSPVFVGPRGATSNGEAVHKDLMVPDILYYDNAEHSQVLREMGRSFDLGCHLMLIGNQGVGKNKIADKFLQTAHRARKYIQLHRFRSIMG